jgi:hypothetical protein
MLPTAEKTAAPQPIGAGIGRPLASATRIAAVHRRAVTPATECGMSSLGERGEAVTLQDLLEQHARVAAAVGS